MIWIYDGFETVQLHYFLELSMSKIRNNFRREQKKLKYVKELGVHDKTGYCCRLRYKS